jgi:hypothetical protein
MHDTGEHSISDFAELFSISRSTVYRTLSRQTDPVRLDAAAAASFEGNRLDEVPRQW